MRTLTNWSKVVAFAAVAAAVLAAGPPALAQGNTTFSIVNNAPMSIYYVYVSPASSGYWGGDWLGDDVVLSGDRYRVRPGSAAGCFYDVKVVYSSGEYEARYDQNLCTISEIVFTGRWRRISTSIDGVPPSTGAIRSAYLTPGHDAGWESDPLGAAVVF